MLRFTSLAATAALAAALAAAATPSRAQNVTITQTNLVANMKGIAKTTDANLRNAWGVANFPGGPYWVSDNAAGLSTLYTGQGAVEGLVVKIAPAPGKSVGSPTGVVWNPAAGTGGFMVTEGGTAVASLFVFDAADGTISAWAPVPGQATPTATTIVVDNSKSGAVYRGLAFGTNNRGNYLFATNFSAGTVEAYDSTFTQSKLQGGFADGLLPKGFAPFGIQNIDGELYVTYAMQDATKQSDVPGPGLGYVNVFSTEGFLQRRFAAKGPLNAPWAVVRAPFSFGKFAGQILVGNFGDGWVNAFSAGGGATLGPLTIAGGTPLVIEGLWSLTPGNGVDSQSEALYFTAGPDRGADGLFGTLTAKVATPVAGGW